MGHLNLNGCTGRENSSPCVPVLEKMGAVARRLSGPLYAYTRLRATLPPAGSTSSGLAASEYTQTSPTPGDKVRAICLVVPLDHRLGHLGFYKFRASAGPLYSNTLSK